MRASELISQLTKALEENGDLEVYITSDLYPQAKIYGVEYHKAGEKVEYLKLEEDCFLI